MKNHSITVRRLSDKSHWVTIRNIITETAHSYTEEDESLVNALLGFDNEKYSTQDAVQIVINKVTDPLLYSKL